VATFATPAHRGEIPGGQEAAQSRGLPGFEVGLGGSVSWLSSDRTPCSRAVVIVSERAARAT